MITEAHGTVGVDLTWLVELWLWNKILHWQYFFLAILSTWMYMVIHYFTEKLTSRINSFMEYLDAYLYVSYYVAAFNNRLAAR